MTEKELHKLFKDKLARREFDFNPANWSAMEEMLDGGKSRMGFFVRTARAIVAFGVIAALLSIFWPQRAQESIIHIPRKSISSGLGDAPYTERNALTPGHFYSAAAGQSTKEEVTNLAQSAAVSGKQTKAIGGEGGNTTNDALPNPAHQAHPVMTKNKSLPGRFTLNATRHGLQPFNFYAAADKASAASVNYVPGGHLLLTGGAGFHTSFGDKPGVNWNIGVLYQWKLGRQFSLATGVEFEQNRNLGIQTRHDSTFFSFGREEVQVHTSYQTINTLRIPLQAEYSLAGGQSFSLGAYTQATITVQKEVQREVFPFKRAPYVENKQSNRYREEINRMQYGITAGYMHKLSERLQLRLRIDYGLADITNDEFEELKGNHQIIKTNLGLRYMIF